MLRESFIEFKDDRREKSSKNIDVIENLIFSSEYELSSQI